MTAFHQHLHLLLIDAQNDFCDLPAPARPALPVQGADADLHRVAALVRDAGDALDAITLTLDSHHRHDIAHPGFWWAAAPGAEVAPFTEITAAQVRAGQFQPRDPAALPRTLAYLDALEAQGRYTLMVWPVHCEVGTWGHQLHDAVRDACTDWELRCQRVSHVVRKGLNPWTEHYSALQAEVPDPADPETGLKPRADRPARHARPVAHRGRGGQPLRARHGRAPGRQPARSDARAPVPPHAADRRDQPGRRFRDAAGRVLRGHAPARRAAGDL